MREVTSDQMLWLLHWNEAGPHPRLTLLAVNGDEAIRAEHAAAVCLACFSHTGVPASWIGATAATRRQVVQGCRTVPTLAMIHLEDEGAGRTAGESLQLSLMQAAEECPRPDPSRGPDPSRPRERKVVVALGTAPASNLSEAEGVVRATLGERLTAFAQREEWSALRTLTALTALVCQETETLKLPEDEDLLDIYDQYSVGGLSAPFPMRD